MRCDYDYTFSQKSIKRHERTCVVSGFYPIFQNVDEILKRFSFHQFNVFNFDSEIFCTGSALFFILYKLIWMYDFTFYSDRQIALLLSVASKETSTKEHYDSSEQLNA